MCRKGIAGHALFWSPVATGQVNALLRTESDICSAYANRQYPLAWRQPRYD